MADLNYFENRRSVRCYTDQHIPDEELKRMIAAATHAPNTGNMQLYSVIVTRSKEGKEALAPAHFNQGAVTSADAVLTFCLDIRRFEHWCHLRKAKPGFDTFQSFVAAVIDTSIFAQQFCTIAEMDGLGTCYLGTTTYNAPDIAMALELPQGVVPVTTVTVGYPAEDATGPTWRLPVERIMHQETYQDTCDADIEEAYASLEADPMSETYIKENGKETLAQVFTDVRYPRESAEYFSSVYLSLLDDNNFEI